MYWCSGRRARHSFNPLQYCIILRDPNTISYIFSYWHTLEDPIRAQDSPPLDEEEKEEEFFVIVLEKTPSIQLLRRHLAAHWPPFRPCRCQIPCRCPGPCRWVHVSVFWLYYQQIRSFSRPRLRWAYCAVLSSLVKFHRALPSVGTVCRPFGRHDLKLGKDSQCIICVQWWARPGHDSPGVARNAEQSKLYLRSAMDLKYICMKLFLRFASTINISQLWSRTQKSGI